MTARTGSAFTPRELGRFLEIQNLGLNLSFALAFLLIAARGWPPWWPVLLAVVAFVGARNAGHAFNRWTDRELDRANPRTQDRALVTGRLSGRGALLLTAVNAAALLGAAALLNPLALLLAPVALALVLGYSATKRWGWGTTLLLGLVEAITPAGAFVAIRASLPPDAGLAVLGVFLWGTAFETVHSLADLASDRRQGLPSLPARIGEEASRRLVPALHALALGAFAALGVYDRLTAPYFVGLGAMAVLAADADRRLGGLGGSAAAPFRRHMLMASVFLVGTAVAILLPGIGPWPG